jgi:hypothetical protein
MVEAGSVRQEVPSLGGVAPFYLQANEFSTKIKFAARVFIYISHPICSIRFHVPLSSLAAVRHIYTAK